MISNMIIRRSNTITKITQVAVELKFNGVSHNSSTISIISIKTTKQKFILSKNRHIQHKKIR